MAIAIELPAERSAGRRRRTSIAAILEVAPDHPDALHYAGVLAHQQGRSDEAIALIERSLELEPEQADWHSNLGIVLQARGGWTRRSRRTSARSRSIPATPTRTTTSACC